MQATEKSAMQEWQQRRPRIENHAQITKRKKENGLLLSSLNTVKLPFVLLKLFPHSPSGNFWRLVRLGFLHWVERIMTDSYCSRLPPLKSLFYNEFKWREIKSATNLLELPLHLLNFVALTLIYMASKTKKWTFKKFPRICQCILCSTESNTGKLFPLRIGPMIRDELQRYTTCFHFKFHGENESHNGRYGNQLVSKI